VVTKTTAATHTQQSTKIGSRRKSVMVAAAVDGDDDSNGDGDSDRHCWLGREWW
jgi:hypothetical protein